MRIGTITYWWTQDNYGQVLQCFALIRFLRHMGHEAFLIKNLPFVPSRNMIRLLRAALKYALVPNYRKTAFMWKRLGKISAAEAKVHPRGFDEFRRKYIPSTETEYTQHHLLDNPPQADAYVCGSDQIWGTPNPVYFLQFGPESSKRIAYAPSMGGMKPQGKNRQTMIEYLRRFDFLSSRERSGVEALHEMGFPEATLQPDPTLLLPIEAYRKMEVKPQITEKPYLFLYLLGNETEVEVRDVYSFADAHGLEVRYVASQGRTDEFPKLYPTVEEWLGLIDGASYVITNSFHGTVFCLQFNTPFLVLPVKGVIARMNNRIHDLLGKFSLSERIYQGSLERLFERVDFQTFNATRAKEAEKVSNIFSNLLK